MISGITNNSIIAALLGPGVIRGPRGASAASSARGAPEEIRAGKELHPQPVDTVEILGARRDVWATGRAADQHAGTVSFNASSGASATTTSLSGSRQTGATKLTQEEQQDVRELKERDREVRAHEQAHKTAAGAHALGRPTFDFTTGPDGKRYAVGGEVSIDTGEVTGDPRATIQKMQQIRQAALAPGNPSAQDHAVAASAQAAEKRARAELAEQREEQSDSDHLGLGKPAKAATATRPGTLLDLIA